MNNNKIRVLFLITDLGKGGAERLLLDICVELQKYSNYEFKIATLFRKNDYQSYTSTFDIIHLDYEPYSFLKKKDYRSYEKLLKSFRPHIVHSHRFLAEFLSSFFVQRDIKYVVHMHDNMTQLRNYRIKELLVRENLSQFIEKKLLFTKKYNKAKTLFISISNDTSAFLEQILPRSLHKNIHFVSNAINYQQFVPPKTVINPSPLTLKILNIGSFHHSKKNQTFLVDIAVELKRRKIDFMINIVGDGILKQDMVKKVRDNNVLDHFIFHGLVDDIPKIMQQNDLYLHTATYEPFGLVLLEAMAAKLPVITLDGKGNRDLIINNQNGIIIEEQDSNIFVDSIIKTMKQTKFRTNLITNGVHTAQSHDIKNYVKKLLEIYKI